MDTSNNANNISTTPSTPESDGLNATSRCMGCQSYTTNKRGSDGLNVQQQAIYTRQQRGHSIILHLLLAPLVLGINLIYITCSKNHYWHI